MSIVYELDGWHGNFVPGIIMNINTLALYLPPKHNESLL